MKLTEFPHLVKEWHPTKNGDLRPEDVTHGSDRRLGLSAQKIEHTNGQLELPIEQAKVLDVPIVGGVLL